MNPSMKNMPGTISNIINPLAPKIVPETISRLNPINNNNPIMLRPNTKVWLITPCKLLRNILFSAWSKIK